MKPFYIATRTLFLGLLFITAITELTALGEIQLFCGETYESDTTGEPNEYQASNLPCYDSGSSFDAGDQIFFVNKTIPGDLVITLFSRVDHDIFLLGGPPGETITCYSSDSYSINPIGNNGLNFEMVKVSNAPLGTYYILVDGYRPEEEGEYEITVTCGELTCTEFSEGEVPTVIVEDCDELECNVPVLGDTNAGFSNNVSAYCGANDASDLGAGETGGEHIYRFSLPLRQEVTITMELLDFVDLDMFLLGSVDADDCIAANLRGRGFDESITITIGPGTFFVVIDGWQSDEGEYNLLLDCCPPPTFFSNCANLEARYQNRTYAYEFQVIDDDDYATGISWFVGNQSGNSDGRFFSYTFPGDGQYEVCYPYYNNDDCIDYCCQTYCIQQQPDCLNGVLTPCVDDCACVEEVAGALPDPFQCEPFQRYDADSDLGSQSRLWTTIPPFNGSTIVEEQSGNKYALFQALEGGIPKVLYELEDGFTNDLGCGRYRLSWSMTISPDHSAAYEVLYEDGFGTLSTNTAVRVDFGTNEVGTITYGNESEVFNYIPGEEVEVMNIVDLDTDRFEFWINHSFVFSFPFSSSLVNGRDLRLWGLVFTGDNDTDYTLDNLCFRARPDQNNCPFVFDEVCVANGERYNNNCEAETQGLYTPQEYGACYSICDFGGEVVGRNDDTDISASLTRADLAPALLNYEDCILQAYLDDGQDLPNPMYADIFLFENQEENIIRVNDAGFEFSTMAFLFQCQTEGDAVVQSCLGLSRDFNGTRLPAGLYYVVIVGGELDDYSFAITPSTPCDTDGAPILMCGDAYTGEMESPETNFQVEPDGAYSSCYNGGRTFIGEEQAFRLEITESTILDVTLTPSEGIAGLALFSTACGSNCSGFAESNAPGEVASLQDLRLAPGNYYLVVDQETPIGNFELLVDNCRFDDDNGGYGGSVSINNNGGAPCNLNDDEHEVLVQITNPGNFRNGDLFWFGLPPEEDRILRNDSLVAKVYNGQRRLVFNLPGYGGDGSEGPPCAYEVGDSLQLYVQTTNEAARRIQAQSMAYANPAQSNDFDAEGRFTADARSSVQSFRPSEVISFELSATRVNFIDNPTRAVTLVLNTNQPWTMSTDDEWISFVQSTGRGSALLDINATQNEAFAPRSGSILVQAGENQAYSLIIDVFQLGQCVEPILQTSDLTPVVCDGTPITLSVTAEPAPSELYTYRWSTGATTPSIEVAPSQTTSYTVVVSQEGCSRERVTTFEVSVGTGPTFSHNAPQESDCSGDLNSYTARLSTAATTVNSSAGQVVAEGGNNYRIQGIPTGTNPEVTLTDVNGCTTKFTITSPSCSCPNTIPAPTSGGDEVICSDDTRPSLSVSTNTALYTVNWYSAASDGQLLQTNSLSYQPTDAGTYYAETVSTDGSPCTSNTRTPVTLTIIPQLIPMPSPAQSTICLDGSITFFANSSGGNGGTQYRWLNENGDVLGFGTNYTYVPQSVGQQRIMLEVSDPADVCVATRDIPIQVLPTPTITEFSQPQDTDCTPDLSTYQVSFTTTGTPNTPPFGQLQDQGSGRYVIIGVPAGQSFTIVSRIGSCTTEQMVIGPPCACVMAVPAPETEDPEVAYCANQSIPSISAEVDADEYYINWYNQRNGGTPLETNNSTFQPLAPGVYYAEAVSIAASECVSPRTAITVNAVPTIAITLSETSLQLCAEETTSLFATANGGSGSLSYTWRSAAGTVLSNSSTLNYLATQVGTTTLTLTVEDADGICSSMTMLPVAVNDNPELSEVSTGQCSPDRQSYSVTFSATGAVDMPNVGVLGALGNNEYSITSIPVGTDIMISTTLGDCTTSETVNSPSCECPSNIPTPISGGDQIVCSDDELPVLSVTVNTEEYTANWYDAQNTLVAMNTTSYQPTVDGVYEVETVSLAAVGCTSTSRTSIRLTVVPDIIITTNTTEATACVGEVLPLLGLANNGSGLLSYSWLQNDQELGTGTSYNYMVSAVGVNTVTLQVNDSDGVCAAEQDIIITASQVPSLGIVSTTFCSEDLSTYGFTVQSNAQQLNTEPSMGVSITAQGNDRYLVTGVPVDTDVTVTATNTFGEAICFNDALINAPDNCECDDQNIPQAALVNGIRNICVGDELPTFIVEDPGSAYTVEWYNDTADPSPFQTGLSYQPTAAGNWFVILRNIANTCPSSVFAPVVLTINEPPEVEAGDNIRACVGTEITLAPSVESNAAIIAYTWTSSGQVITPQQPDATLVVANSELIRLEVTDANNCTDSDALQITALPKPAVDLDAIVMVACAGDQNGVIEADISGGTSPYFTTWSDGIENVNPRTGMPAGVYTVVVRDVNSCIDSATYELVAPFPLTLVSYDSTNVIETDGSRSEGNIRINMSGGTGTLNITWTDADGNVIASGEEMTTSLPGTYTATVQDAEGCLFQQNFELDLVVSVNTLVDEVIPPKVYPNPTTAKLFVNWTQPPNERTDLELFDAQGRSLRRVADAWLPTGNMELDMVDLPDGLYFLRVEVGTLTYHYKIIKQ